MRRPSSEGLRFECFIKFLWIHFPSSTVYSSCNYQSPFELWYIQVLPCWLFVSLSSCIFLCNFTWLSHNIWEGENHYCHNCSVFTTFLNFINCNVKSSSRCYVNGKLYLIPTFCVPTENKRLYFVVIYTIYNIVIDM